MFVYINMLSDGHMIQFMVQFVRLVPFLDKTPFPLSLNSPHVDTVVPLVSLNTLLKVPISCSCGKNCLSFNSFGVACLCA